MTDRRFIKIDPVHELLKAAQIVGLRPREVTLIALEELARDEGRVVDVTDTAADLKQWARERDERLNQQAEERRAEFFKDRSDIPDLMFLTPYCPICDLPTTAEDGGFLCYGCHVAWPGNGYGHEASRWDE